MSDILDYPGKELEVFDKADFWRKYLFKKIEKYIGDEILEVGAGMGSFTKTYYNKNKKIVLSELDPNLTEILDNRFKKLNNIKIESKYTKNIENKFDSILYISVLEHIENDVQEIETALTKLKNNGHIIICVPAHNYMYSNFDKEIGHFRRYEINFFKNLKIRNVVLEKCYMLDSIGWLMYFLNKIFFKNEDYPSKFKVMIWDKIFVPVSIILDFLTFYKFGKNIICVLKKKN